jgi:transposase
VLRSEPCETVAAERGNPLVRLPVFAEPGPGEALCSWLCRLGAAIDLPPLVLARRAFAVDGRTEPDWWRRPGADRLGLVSARTGVAVDRLRDMTFDGWAHARDDELPRRFHPSRRLRARDRRRPLAVCSRCFAEDKEPYVRRDWMVGWVSVCARHRTVLIAHCPSCLAMVRTPAPSSRLITRVGWCWRCGAALTGKSGEQAAYGAILAVQDRLLSIKRQGAGQMPGLGEIDWRTLMVLIDLVLSIVWQGTADHARERLFDRVVCDLDLDREARFHIEWTTNYGALVLLAWLFEEWSHRLGAACAFLQAPRAGEMIARLGNVGGNLERNLQVFLPAPVLGRTPEPASWPSWLETLPSSSALRARADHELHSTYSIRLSAIAMLRDKPDITAVARAVRVRPETVQRWVHLAAAQGLDALVARPLRRCDLTPEQLSCIETWLSSVRRTAGGPSGWSAEHAQREIAARFGVTISAAAARNLLEKHRPTRFRRTLQQPEPSTESAF